MSIVRNADLLLVHSDARLAEITCFRLELLGYGIRVCCSGTDALSEISKSVPDLIIVDTTLTDMDGLEWLTRLRAEYAPVDLPALVFSQDPSLETVERAFMSGAQDYLLTPFDPTVLEQKVERLLDSKFSKSPAQ
ncbi:MULTISPECIES: response regulator [Crateriforma]|uniref:Transcriptional regulatory protein ZraR n=1 Tax=Crateriforma conspicua TaxID=2527996 RepID=A0A5C6FTC8_9PLAN|nr:MULTISPECIES: response regulator [Crateriforma]TWU63451.1 Transcriptional regulatory protein ZraR [Crateriforma conspicua]